MQIIKNKSKKGLTLIELLLALAVAAILMISGIRFWNNFITEAEVENTSDMLSSLGVGLKKSMASLNQGQFTNGTLTNPTLTNLARSFINEKFLTPTQMLTSLGGTFTVNYAPALIPNARNTHSIIVQLSNIDAKECSLLVTNLNILDTYKQVRINAMSSNIEVGGNSNTNLLVSACAGGNNNISLGLLLNDVLSEESNQVLQSDAYIRGADSSAYIGGVINSAPASGSGTCGGGSSWNSSRNQCVCPVNTKWMGIEQGCVAFNNVRGLSGVCNLDYALSETTKRCERLSPSNNAGLGVYTNGKILPAHSATNNINGANYLAPENVQTPAPTAFIDVPSNTEIIAGRTITSGAITAGQYFTNSCLRGTLVGGRCKTN